MSHERNGCSQDTQGAGRKDPESKGFTPRDRLQLIRQARMLNEVHKAVRSIQKNHQHTR
ncbi:MAG: hypothetical protein AAFX52_11950 [Pseudomonadota bacterium]